MQSLKNNKGVTMGKKIEIQKIEIKNIDKLFPFLYDKKAVSTLTMKNAGVLITNFNNSLNDISQRESINENIILEVIFISFDGWLQQRTSEESLDDLIINYEIIRSSKFISKTYFPFLRTFIKTKTSTKDMSKEEIEFFKENIFFNIKNFINDYKNNFEITYRIINTKDNLFLKQTIFDEKKIINNILLNNT